MHTSTSTHAVLPNPVQDFYLETQWDLLFDMLERDFCVEDCVQGEVGLVAIFSFFFLLVDKGKAQW